jgi:hypothetical protein
MKITQKKLRIISGLLILIGAIVYAVTKPSPFGKYAAIGIMIIGMIFLAPWIKDKDIE